MRRMVTRTIRWGGDGSQTSVRVVRGSLEDEFLQQFECPPPSRPPSTQLPLRERLAGFYYESRWVLLLIACQITSISLVCWATYRLVHGS